MGRRDYWVKNSGVHIHVVECSTSNNSIPLLICPGLSESAEDYLGFISSLSPKRCIALSFRGRGKSEAPEVGYTLEDHISDINTVVEYLGLQKFYLLGNSRGVSYALGYTLQNLDRLKGLILIDYPACHKKMPEGWAEEYLNSLWGDKLGSELMKTHVVMGIEKESFQVDFWDELKHIDIPSLIIYGREELGSLLSLDQVTQYKRELRNCRMKQCYSSGHGISDEDYDGVITEILKFICDSVV